MRSEESSSFYKFLQISLDMNPVKYRLSIIHNFPIWKIISKVWKISRWKVNGDANGRRCYQKKSIKGKWTVAGDHDDHDIGDQWTLIPFPVPVRRATSLSHEMISPPRAKHLYRLGDSKRSLPHPFNFATGISGVSEQ